MTPRTCPRRFLKRSSPRRRCWKHAGTRQTAFIHARHAAPPHEPQDPPSSCAKTWRRPGRHFPGCPAGGRAARPAPAGWGLVKAWPELSQVVKGAIPELDGIDWLGQDRMTRAFPPGSASHPGRLRLGSRSHKRPFLAAVMNLPTSCSLERATTPASCFTPDGSSRGCASTV